MQNLHCLLCPIPIFFRSLKINLCLPLFHLDTGSITASKLAIHTACQLQISDIGSALEAFLRVAFYRPAVLSQYERVTFCLRGGCCVVQRHLDWPLLVFIGCQTLDCTKEVEGPVLGIIAGQIHLGSVQVMINIRLKTWSMWESLQRPRRVRKGCSVKLQLWYFVINYSSSSSWSCFFFEMIMLPAIESTSSTRLLAWPVGVAHGVLQIMFFRHASVSSTYPCK